MPKTKIDWCDISINPVKGYCPNKDCPLFEKGCYAHNLYNRFKWNKSIRVDWQVTSQIPTKPSRIFVGSTMELFGDWIKPEWLKEIFSWATRYPQHTYIFLTKKPDNLIKYSPFPDNCWVGVSACNNDMAIRALNVMPEIKVKRAFVSFEPLYGEITIEKRWYKLLDWVIIGQQTPIRNTTMPEYEWIEEIVKSADLANIPVFIKDNLNSCEISDYPTLLDAKGNLRQEFPNERKD